ncbi:MAG: hypothetical protein U1E10_05935 [Bdellovibrionales bacterium]|nr:hypothetical protein [Bdellovibrionales bacterium]
MSRWMSGGSDQVNRKKPVGLLRGVLDFELDIGVVGDVDLDPLSPNLGNARPADPEFEASAFSLDTNSWLSIQGNEFGQSLFIGTKRVALPADWKNPDFPFVRGLPDGNILVSDTTFDSSHKENTWILSRKGDVLARFGIGSAAVEISPLEGGMIAVAYHPLSAKRFGHRVEPQQRTAIAFFDTRGKLLTTFNHEAGRTETSAENVRCMTRISPVELIFIPETLVSRGQLVENPIVFYKCATGRTMAFSAPFGLSEAVSLAHNLDGDPYVLLASPEGFEDQVIGFDPARKISQYLGSFVGIFRGLAESRAIFSKEAAKAVRPVISAQPDKQGAPARAASFNPGGFLAQEVVAEYQWVVADPTALPQPSASSDENSNDRTDRSGVSLVDLD